MSYSGYEAPLCSQYDLDVMSQGICSSVLAALFVSNSRSHVMNSSTEPKHTSEITVRKRSTETCEQKRKNCFIHGITHSCNLRTDPDHAAAMVFIMEFPLQLQMLDLLEVFFFYIDYAKSSQYASIVFMNIG